MDNFYELLMNALPPELLTTPASTPTTEQKLNTAGSLIAKDNIAGLSLSRKNERDWKDGQKKRGQLSRNSLLLNKAKENPNTLGQGNSLVNPQHPINTTNVSGNLLK